MKYTFSPRLTLDVVPWSPSWASASVLALALLFLECGFVAVFAQQSSAGDASANQVGEAIRSSSKVVPGVKPKSGQQAKDKKPISETEALAKVKALPEVKQFFALFKGGKSKLNGVAKIEVEPEQGKWMVHVYEQLPDHTATMNWYEVDMKTGKVSKMF